MGVEPGTDLKQLAVELGHHYLPKRLPPCVGVAAESLPPSQAVQRLPHRLARQQLTAAAAVSLGRRRHRGAAWGLGPLCRRASSRTPHQFPSMRSSPAAQRSSATARCTMEAVARLVQGVMAVASQPPSQAPLHQRSGQLDMLQQRRRRTALQRSMI